MTEIYLYVIVARTLRLALVCTSPVDDPVIYGYAKPELAEGGVSDSAQTPAVSSRYACQ